MVERLRMFPRTKEAIRRKLNEINRKLEESSKLQQSFDQDGDTIHDAVVYQTLLERQRLEIEKSRLQRCLTGEIEAISEENLRDKPEISSGHRVLVQIVYPKGEGEQLSVTIGTKLDKQFLTNNDLVDFDPNGVLISEESDLAKALFGKTKGQSVGYETKDGAVKVKILDINISELAKNQ